MPRLVMEYLAFSGSLGEKRHNLLLYLLALAFRTSRLCFVYFSKAYGHCKYFVTFEAEIVVNWHNLP